MNHGRGEPRVRPNTCHQPTGGGMSFSERRRANLVFAQIRATNQRAAGCRSASGGGRTSCSPKYVPPTKVPSSVLVDDIKGEPRVRPNTCHQPISFAAVAGCKGTARCASTGDHPHPLRVGCPLGVGGPPRSNAPSWRANTIRPYNH